MKLNNFNYWIFLITTAIYGVLAFLSFVAYAAADEGTLGNNIFFIFLSKLFLVFMFPAIFIFWKLISEPYNFTLFLTGLTIDVLFYGLLTERIISIIRKRRAAREN